MRSLLFFAVIFSVIFISSTAFILKTTCFDVNTLRIYNSKEAAKEEQWRIQQEILSRRKNKTQMKQYFEEVEQKRKAVSATAKETIWSKSSDEEDPLVKWKEAKKNGNIKSLGYEPEPSRKDSKLGINIVIPQNPMGIPRYDNGERFDLRLPYAERGYEDPDADIMGKMWKGITGIFGKKDIKSSSNNENDGTTGNKMNDKR
jgi:hypothetical protein